MCISNQLLHQKKENFQVVFFAGAFKGGKKMVGFRARKVVVRFSYLIEAYCHVYIFALMLNENVLHFTFT